MASKYRKKFTMPEGFYQVLEDYSREVLRDQPRDIIEFSYLYFKALEEVSPCQFLVTCQQQAFCNSKRCEIQTGFFECHS